MARNRDCWCEQAVCPGLTTVAKESHEAVSGEVGELLTSFIIIIILRLILDCCICKNFWFNSSHYLLHVRRSPRQGLRAGMRLPHATLGSLLTTDTTCIYLQLPVGTPREGTGRGRRQTGLSAAKDISRRNRIIKLQVKPWHKLPEGGLASIYTPGKPKPRTAESWRSSA